jgi:hypothetical protein
LLARLDPTDCALLAQVGPLWLAAVVDSGLPRAGKTAGVPLKINQFVFRRATGLGQGQRLPVGGQDV